MDGLSGKEREIESVAIMASEIVKGIGDRLLKVGDVSACLGVSVRKVWRMIADGQLPRPVKLGNSTRIVESEFLIAFERIKGCRVGGAK